MNRRKLPCLLHNVYLVIFLKLRKHKDSGSLLPTVVDHLSAELMRIIVVQVFQLLPVFPVGSGIVPASAGLPGFFNPVQYQLAPVGVFRSSFQEKASFFSAGTVHDTADQQSVFVSKDRGTDFSPCRHTLLAFRPSDTCAFHGIWSSVRSSRISSAGDIICPFSGTVFPLNLHRTHCHLFPSHSFREISFPLKSLYIPL